MRRHALLGVLAAISCAHQATAWDSTCWDCSTFRASLVSARAAGVERGVVVDGAGRSALLDVATSANAAAGAAACVGGALRMIVGSLRRDAPPALMFIISAWEAGTAAH